MSAAPVVPAPLDTATSTRSEIGIWSMSETQQLARARADFELYSESLGPDPDYRMTTAEQERYDELDARWAEAERAWRLSLSEIELHVLEIEEQLELERWCAEAGIECVDGEPFPLPEDGPNAGRPTLGRGRGSS